MRRAPAFAFDMPLFLCILYLVGLGIVFIHSASYPKAMGITDTGFNSFYYAGRQIIFAGIGLVAMFIITRIPMAFLRQWYQPIAGIVLVLLIAVLVIGTAKHGNKSFIELGGGQFQPSEFAKPAIVIALAAYLAANPSSVKTWRALVRGPLWFFLVPVILVCLQQDFGTAVMMSCGILVMLAIAGVQFRYWGLPGLLLVSLGALALMAGLGGQRIDRVDAWLHPFNVSNQVSHQPRNSLIAVGSGGVFGLGFCQSRQKWFYLPGPQNDYILAIMAEELGLIRLALFLFLPLMFLIYRAFNIAHLASDEFSAMVGAGCTVMLATQALINMAVVLNVIPCMGLNLPFISYGGSSIIASLMMAGLLLNISSLRQAREPRPAAPRATRPATS